MYVSCSCTNVKQERKPEENNGKQYKTMENNIEKVICQESDLVENEMKAYNLTDTEQILVVRQNGQIYAVGNKCTHYGAPLHTGALGKGHVRCPWHGACFNLETGDIEDFPGLDSLPCFSVEVQNGNVKVRGSKTQLAAGRRQKVMKSRDTSDKRVFVIAGGGPAAQVCAETLRQEGYEGRLIMLCKENFLPYDRTKMSKALDTNPAKVALRSTEFYRNADIEVKLGNELVKLDTARKTAEVSTGEKITYDSIFLATGARARRMELPGSNLKNVFVLRNADDANKIDKALDANKHVLIVGASFIGMESAAYCVEKAKSVTVVGMEAVPFARILGVKVGSQIMKWFEEKGVNICMSSNVAEFLPSKSDSSSVGEVKLSNGQVLPADIVITGIGVIANTGYLQGTSLKLGPGSTIPVNEFLESKISGVFAGGDVAQASVLGTEVSIGHWQLAQYHGKISALNMLGKRKLLRAIPFFWTMFFGKGIRYSGFAPDFDEEVIHGNLGELKFIAYYCKGDTVSAVATCGNDPLASHFSFRLAVGRTLTKQEVSEDPTAWINK